MNQDKPLLTYQTNGGPSTKTAQKSAQLHRGRLTYCDKTPDKAGNTAFFKDSDNRVYFYFLAI